jgi:hypothetical protein
VIDLNPENVWFIIAHLREFQAQETVEFPDEVPTGAGFGDEDEALAEAFSETHQEDELFEELRSTIDDLEPDQQITLVALMWLGRGDFSLDEWDDALEEAREAFNGRTAAYLLSTPLAADYLEEGLDQHGYTRE